MSDDKQKMSTLLIKDESMTNKDWLDLSWNYFSLLSGQRMGMVDFYIVIEMALVGALFALMALENRMLWAECTVTAAITFFSVTFFILDCRTKAMIHSCEEVIKDIEAMHYPKKAKCDKIRLPFHLVDYKTDKMRVRMTYSKVFIILYFAMGIFGMVCLLLLLVGAI